MSEISDSMNSAASLDHNAAGRGGVLACVDTSAYALSVCDHANWFSDRMRAPVRLMHAREAGAAPSDPDAPPSERWRSEQAMLRSAEMRLREAGAGEVSIEQPLVAFAEAARTAQAELIVMGRRGDDSERQGRPVGSNVRALAYQTETPVCFAPKIFIPIGRALVLICDASDDDRAVRFLEGHAWLQELQVHFVLVRAAEADAPQTFRGAALDRSETAAEAVGRDADLRGVDLIIASRRALPTHADASTLGLGAGFWSWRAPILVC